MSVGGRPSTILCCSQLAHSLAGVLIVQVHPSVAMLDTGAEEAQTTPDSTTPRLLYLMPSGADDGNKVRAVLPNPYRARTA